MMTIDGSGGGAGRSPWDMLTSYPYGFCLLPRKTISQPQYDDISVPCVEGTRCTPSLRSLKGAELKNGGYGTGPSMLGDGAGEGLYAGPHPSSACRDAVSEGSMVRAGSKLINLKEYSYALEGYDIWVVLQRWLHHYIMPR
jgi:hypothetical protein